MHRVKHDRYKYLNGAEEKSNLLLKHSPTIVHATNVSPIKFQRIKIRTNGETSRRAFSIRHRRVQWEKMSKRMTTDAGTRLLIVLCTFTRTTCK